MKSDELEKSSEHQEFGAQGIAKERKLDGEVQKAPKYESVGADQNVEVPTPPLPAPEQLPVTVQKRRQTSLKADIGLSKSNQQSTRPSEDTPRGRFSVEEILKVPPTFPASAPSGRKTSSASSALGHTPKETPDGTTSSTSSKDSPTSQLSPESKNISETASKPKVFRKYEPQNSPPTSVPQIQTQIPNHPRPTRTFQSPPRFQNLYFNQRSSLSSK